MSYKYQYSVFLANVGTCSDRYCPSYAAPFSLEQLVDRAASIEGLDGIDLVATPDLVKAWPSLHDYIKKSGLKIASIAADTFTEAKWRKGSFSSTDRAIREDAVKHAKEVMDMTEEAGSDILTLWLGQDGYDYVFAADFIQERRWIEEAVQELCDYKPNMRVGLEYKVKEPRTHSYVSTVGTTMLMIHRINRPGCVLIMDYGHALMGYESPAEAVAIAQDYGDKLGHVHINDNYRYWDDDMITGSIRQSEFLEFYYWLNRLGYEGFITIDQFPYREDGRDACEESLRWLQWFDKKSRELDDAEVRKVLAANDGTTSSRFMRKLITGE